MKTATLIILSIFLSLKSFGDETLFIQANTEYANENYSTAISLYDSILSMNLESSELFYNLGNCYYKTKDWANTIWHYEKSLQLNPRNNNATHNLELARLRIIDQIEPIPKLFYKRWWEETTQLFTTKIWQILAIMYIWLILIFQLTKKFFKLKNKYFRIFLNAIGIIIICITYTNIQQNKNEAIIFSSSVIVNSAPSEKSTNLFSLHSGTKVELTEQIGDWLNIRILNGNTGWIKTSHCKIIK
tara:strand:- start:8404 stop:9135 length:732 start_codon:yes stop_codon:yes gene_type:complete